MGKVLDIAPHTTSSEDTVRSKFVGELRCVRLAWFLVFEDKVSVIFWILLGEAADDAQT